MTQGQSAGEPKLAKPGAGLPPLQWAVARYILLPKYFKSTDKSAAIENFTRESTKILTLARGLQPAQLCERRLVPRLRGLEDSSRYWSVAMVLEHLIIVGDLMRQAVVDLSHGSSDLPRVGTADVKPAPEVDTAIIIGRFEEMTAHFVEDIKAADVDAFPDVTHPHPWFGPLNARKWMAFGGLHQSIHRQQIKEIIKRL